MSIFRTFGRTVSAPTNLVRRRLARRQATTPADRLAAAVSATLRSSFEQLETRTLFAAPTLTSISTFTGGTEDTVFQITYANLKAASDAADADGDAIRFRIEAISGGTLKKGSTTISAGATIQTGDTLNWTPAANVNGAGVNAFTVKAVDVGNNASASAVQVKVNLDAVNDAPSLTSVNTLTGGTEDTAYPITFDALAAAAQGDTDVDGDPVRYQLVAKSTGNLFKNGVAVSAGAILEPNATWTWVPAANAFGTLNAFTIKTVDSSDVPSATPVQVKITLSSANDAPTLSTVATLTGATEDTAYTITYASLAAASDAVDADTPGVKPSFRVESVTGGTLTKGGVAVTPGTTTLGTGETWVWTPATNLNGVLPAFTVKAYDGTLASTSAVQVNVNVAAANDAPTLTGIDTFAGGTEDVEYTISYDALVGATDLSDIDSTTMWFKVAAISSGTLTYDNGVDSGLAVVAGTTLIKPGYSLTWVPAANANGAATNAFTVKLNDGTTDSSSTAQVKVDLASVADAPTLTTVTTLTGATEDAAFNITYAAFAAAANEADGDGHAISFRIESVTSGTLTKNAVAVVPGTTLFSTGDTLVWTPDPNANGTLNAFTVRAAEDAGIGLLSATPVQVKVTATAANDTPVLSFVGTLGTVAEDTAYPITYASLLAASDASDADGQTVQFRIEAVSTGTLKKNNVAVVAGTTTITTGDTLTWTPAANAAGVLNAFTVKAYDGTAASGSAIQVKVAVDAVNDAPTLTTINALTGATEDAPFNITHADIAAAANEADVDSSTINYEITALGTGTLTQNGIPVTVGKIITASDTLVWTPATNANGTGSNALTAFSVKAHDGALASSTAVPVKVAVTNVNDTPTLTSISTLSSANEDTAYTITYANLLAASNASDVEGPLQFRIEAVSGGTLTKGGSAVVAGTTTIGTAESLVWTPAAHVNGVTNAFTVKAYDGTAASSSAVQVKVNVNAVNDAPTLTTISALPGATEDTAFTITYADLAGASNVADPDGTTPKFLIAAVSSGTLTKNGVAVVPNTTTLQSGESLVWTPAANVNGANTNAFTVKADDGVLKTAAAIQVKVNIAAVNDAPTFTSANNLTGATEDAPFTITYAALKAASNVADAENGTITFRIDSVVAGTLTKGGTPIDPGVTTLALNETLVWTPAANANGTGVSALPIMTVTAYDGTAYSAGPVTIKADVANANDAPTLTAITTFEDPDQATEDTAYTLTYAALAAAADEADIDGTTVLFRIEAVSSGTLKKNGVAVTAGTTTFGPGETLVWTPGTNVAGAATTAFTVKAWDGTAASASAIAVQIDVDAVNDAPSLSTVATLTTNTATDTPTEDVDFDIDFAHFHAQTNAVDPEGDAVEYRIEAVSSGTLLINGGAVTPGTTVFQAGDTLTWTPDADANGTLNAFTVVAGDGTDYSATPIQVKVTVTAVNDDVPEDDGSVTAIAGGTEDTPLTITYADLLAATGMTDPDPEQTLSFRVESVVSGTLTKNGVAVVAGTTLVGAGESLVWTPTANANGNGTAAFTVKGWDGVGASASASDIDVDVAAVNDAPTLSTVTTLATNTATDTPTEDTAFDVDFDWFHAQTNAADADSGDTISYRIESVVNGTLTKGGNPVVPGTTVFESGDTLVWTPSADANGTVGAFKVVASDGTLFSSTAITVNVTVAADDDAPTLTTVSTITRGLQGKALTITYADLKANSDLADADGGAINFRIESIESGTLTKGAGNTAIVAGTTELAPGEYLTWTPDSDDYGNALDAFTVVGYDGTADSGTPVTVKVDVAHIVQMPTLSTIATLTTNTDADTPTEDTAFTIDYAYFLAATNAADPEGGAIGFRIESVASGTLTKGGVAVVPGTTLFETGDDLVWTPALNANGADIIAFYVRAVTAGGVSSTKVAVKVTVAADNDAPTITVVSPVKDGGEDAPINISYETLVKLADLKDADTGDTLIFRIAATSSGTLEDMNGDPVVDGTTTLAAGEYLTWTPAGEASGLLNAFTIEAFDGTDYSAAPVQVKVIVAAINDAPTLTEFDVLTGATAGVAYNVTYADLIGAGDQDDEEGATINFVIAKVLSGTLTKNGVAVIPGVTRVKTGDTLVWTSAAGASGDTDAFSLFASDGQSLSGNLQTPENAIVLQINVA